MPPNVTNRPAWATNLLCFFAFVGLLLFAIYLSLLNRALPSLVFTVTGTWMSLFLCIFAMAPLLADHVATGKHDCCSCCSLRCCCDLGPLEPGFFWRRYHLMVAVISVLLALGWFIGGRPDGGVWSLTVLLPACVYLYLERQQPAETSVNIDLSNTPPTADLHRQHPAETSVKIDISNTPTAAELQMLSDQKGYGGQGMICAVQSEGDQNTLPTASQGYTVAVASCMVAVLRSLALVLYACLLGGCWVQATNYQSFAPDGTFVTVGINGVSQRILTQCHGPRSDVVPTIWVEVGGGGHSMSDLWGFRDYMVDTYQRRVCSYDMPGTGWSDPRIINQPQITDQVIEAMAEPGPFICLGSMDGGDVRCLKYCSANPRMCRAVVPIAFGSSGEFQDYVDYYFAGDADRQEALVETTCAFRKGMGNVINFFAVSWGIIPSVIAAPEYEPKVTTMFPLSSSYNTHVMHTYQARHLSHPISHYAETTSEPDFGAPVAES